MSETGYYFETVQQYVLERQTELPEEMKAEYRIKGVNPDELWELIWSYQTEEAAKLQLAREEAKGSKIWKWRMRDLGGAKTIKRVAW